VAYMIIPEWQGMGLGRALQDRMTEYAKARGLRGFTAEILVENAKMINLAKIACNHVTFQRHEDTYEVTMLFD